MAPNSDDDAGIQVIAGRSVADWDERWEHVPDGFRRLQSDLRAQVGVFAGKQGNQIMLIAAAAQRNAGFRAGLARGRLRDQSGNNSFGMKGLRGLGDTIEAYIIKMNSATKDDITELKWALIDVHQPPCNAPKEIVTAARKAAYAKRDKVSGRPRTRTRKPPTS